MIYTSYYGKLKQLPETVTPINIALYKPKNISIQSYPILFPTGDMLYNLNHNNNYTIFDFEKEYKDRILSELNVETVVFDLLRMAAYKDVALIGYGTPDNFSHRELVKHWLKENGIKCQEY